MATWYNLSRVRVTRRRKTRTTQLGGSPEPWTETSPRRSIRGFKNCKTPLHVATEPALSEPIRTFQTTTTKPASTQPITDFRTHPHVTMEPTSLNPTENSAPRRRNQLPATRRDLQDSSSRDDRGILQSNHQNAQKRIGQHCQVRTIRRFRTSPHVTTEPSTSEPIRNFRSITTEPLLVTHQRLQNPPHVTTERTSN